MIIFLKKLASAVAASPTGKVTFFVDENGYPKVKDDAGVLSDFVGPAGATGPAGTTGAAGSAATVTVGTVTTGSAGSSVIVTNSGTTSNAILDFTIPQGMQGIQGIQGLQGIQGVQGNAATISVGTTTTGAPGSSASVTNSGSSSAATFNFTIPRGDTGPTGSTGSTGAAGAAATISVGTVTTGTAGSSAIITNSGSSSAATFDFTIPRGDVGATGSTGSPGSAATIAVGTVTTGAPGSSAIVTNVGTSSAATFDFTIPEGQPGSSTQVDTAFNIADATDATKKINFDAGGTTSTTTTISAAQTANRTISLPNATTTLVGVDTTDTLTNKTLTSPDLTGIPTAPTASNTTNTTQLATTAFVQSVIASIPSVNTRNVGGGGGGYTSISTAIASCPTPSITNRYVINIEAGTYTEPMLNIPSFIYLVGADERAVIIQPASSHDVIQINNSDVYVSFLTIANAPAGFCGIRVTDANDYSLMHKVHITGCDNGLVISTTTSATNDNLFYTEYCDIEECGAPLVVTSTHATYIAYLQNENMYIGNYTTPFTGTEAALVTGNTQCVFNNGTIENLSNPGTGVGLRFYDGAILDMTGMIVNQWATGILCPNTGNNPTTTLRFINLTNNTEDLDLSHIGLTGAITAYADITKANINANVNVMIDIIDPINRGTTTLGAFNLGQTFDKISDYSHAIIEQMSTGLLNGGDPTFSSSSLVLNISAGNGYALTGLTVTDYLKYINFSAQSVTLPANSTTYIAVDTTNTLVSNSVPYDQKLYLILGSAVTNSSGVITFKTITRRTNNISSQIEEMLRDVIGATFKSGCIVTENGTTARALNVTSGEYYFGSTEFKPTGGTSIPLVGLYRNGSGGWTYNSLSQVPNTVYDNNTGTPVSLTATYYANFYLYLANDGAQEKYFLVYGQNQYLTSTLADAEPLPTTPSWMNENVISVSRVMIQQGATNTVSIKDIRPFSSAGSSVSIPVTSVFARTGDIVSANGDYTASQITNVASGNISSTTVQAALNELQTDIDTRATSSSLTTHTSATAAHGVTGNIVGTSDTQALTNKTIVATSNTVVTAASGNLTSTDLNSALSELQTDIDTRATSASLSSHTGATSAHGVTGAIVGTTDTQTLTNKTIVAVNNTITTAASGNLTSTSLNAALSELQTDIDTRALNSDLTTHTGSTAAHGATGAVMGTTNTQTVTNKSLSDTTTAIVDATDATKKIIFDAAGTTATATTLLSSQTTNRTITLPDATDTLVGKATTDTLTNKSISGSTNTITNVSLTTGVTGTLPIANGGTGATTIANAFATLSPISTQGDMIIGDAVGASVILPIGTNTQVLTSNGTTAVWTTPSSGGTTFSDATFDVHASVDATKKLLINAAGTTATSTTLTTSQTTNKVITLPDATDTLVGKATVDTLTNKTLTSPIISTISNTGTLTLPVSTDTLVGRATTDTLTNKTLTSPVISTIVNTGTLTLPTATDTLVARTTTDTLTNKSLSDTTTAIVDSVDATKKILYDAAGTTGTSTTITAAQTANRVITYPDATTTLVGTNNTVTLIGKSLSDTTTFVVDVTDATKRIGFDAAGTTGTTTTLLSSQTVNRTLTLPDATDTVVVAALAQTLTNKTLTSPIIGTIVNTGTLTLPTATDTLVGRLTTDTLTNKTISGATNTITNISLTTGVTGILPAANGGTNQSTYATGDIVYASAANTLSKLPIGTSTQVLTVTGGVPTWAASAGGSSSPTTTLGDLIVRGASVDARLPIGTTNQVLTVVGGTAAWAAAPGGGSGSPGGSTGQMQYNSAGTFAGATNVLVDNNDLTLVTNTAPVSPATGNTKLFARSLANRMFPAFVGPTGQDTELQPFFGRNAIGVWKPPGNATTVPGVFGITALTATGTATARNVATTNVATRTKRLGFVSAATAGSLCGGRVAVAQFTTGDGVGFGGFFTSIRFCFSDAVLQTTGRTFVGVSASTAAPTNVEANTLVNSVGVGTLGTDATQMYLFYGGSTAQTAIALGATNFPINLTNVYDIHLFSPINATGIIHYSVINCNNNAVTTGTLSGAATVVPASTTLLTHQIWRSNNAAAAAVGIDIISIYIENDI